MTHTNGFVWGTVVGLGATIGAMSIEPIMSTAPIISTVPIIVESVRNVLILFLTSVYVFRFFVTIRRAMKRGSLINPTADGFVTGISLANGFILLLSYGIRVI